MQLVEFMRSSYGILSAHYKFSVSGRSDSLIDAATGPSVVHIIVP